MISSGVLSGLTSISVYTALVYVLGRLILHRIGASTDGLTLAGAPVIGAATLGSQLWLYGLLRIPWDRPIVFLPWAVLAIVTRQELVTWVREDWRRGRRAVATVVHMDTLTIALAALTIVIVLSFLINLVAQPLSAWDAISDWLLKAKHFYAQQSASLSGIWPIHVEKYSVVLGLHMADFQRHPDYPPLFPLMVASLYTVIGRADDSLGKAINFVFLISAAAACFVYARALVGSQLATVFTFLIVAMPKFLGALFSRFPADYMGMADYALAVVMFLSLAHLANVKRLRPFQGVALALIFAAIAGLIKNEGLVFLATITGVIIVQAIRLRTDTLPRLPMQLLLPIGVAFAAVACWQIYIKQHGFTADFLANGHPGELVPQLPIRALTIVAYVFSTHPFSFHGDYGWLALCYGLCAALLIRQRFRTGGAPFVVFNLQIISYFLVYLFTPLPLVFHLASSFDRLVLELTPSLLLILAMSLSPLMPSATNLTPRNGDRPARTEAIRQALRQPSTELAGVT